MILVLCGRTLNIIASARTNVFTVSGRIVEYYVTKYAFFVTRTWRYFDTKKSYSIGESEVFFDFCISRRRYDIVWARRLDIAGIPTLSS
jgi:hypothetical protein